MAKMFRISRGAAGPTPGIMHDAKDYAIYTPEQVEALNREQNRRHITGAEMEAMICLTVGGNLLIKHAPVIYHHAEHRGKLRQLKRLITTTRNLLTTLNMAVEVRQMGSICTQLENNCISVSSEPVEGYVNIRLHDLLTICNKAMDSCSWSCTCTREESKSCELRRALELVPGVNAQGKEIARKDATKCPYRGMEMEVEGDA